MNTQTVNAEVKNYNFTDLELNVIKNIKNLDNPSYFFVDEIMDDVKRDRGVISSLVKKGVLYVDTDFDGLVSVFARELFTDGFFD